MTDQKEYYAGLVERLKKPAPPFGMEEYDPTFDLRQEAAHEIRSLLAQVEELRRERDEARAKLFPYADASEISGMSWNGIYLIGDKKSIAELSRIENTAAQIEVYRQAFKERLAVAEARATKAEAEAETLSLAYNLELEAREKAEAGIAEAVRLLTDLVPPPGFRETGRINVDGQIPVDMHLRTARAARAFVEKHK
ncbi:hypothetical protein ACN6KF_001480 [Labrys sp. La1]|uniref:hypothetical protein n=1 Tax=Labrys sp. La1 TaxID=3404917 RepID=UPI003EB8F762